MKRVELLLSEINISMFELNQMVIVCHRNKKLKKKEKIKQINMYKKPNNNLKKVIKKYI
jgi:hypothetical protein